MVVVAQILLEMGFPLIADMSKVGNPTLYGFAGGILMKLLAVWVRNPSWKLQVGHSMVSQALASMEVVSAVNCMVT